MMVSRHLGRQSVQRKITKLEANVAHLRLKMSYFSGEMFKGFEVL
jgi:hypothetical protein